MRPRILVIGSSNIDFIIRLDRLPVVGETVTDGQFMQTFGGKGANQAVAAARAGGQVTFITCLGNDPQVPALMGNFREAGIDAGRIVHVADGPSGAALVMFDQAGANYLAVAPGSNYRLEPGHLDACRDDFAAASLVVLQMELRPDTTLRALELARQAGKPVVFNFAPVPPGHLALDPAMGILVVNEHEAGALLGCGPVAAAEAPEAARQLVARGLQSAIITLGRDGACAQAGGQAFRVPGRPVRAVDTTGAGDTFTGALAVALAERRPMPEALDFANRAAALSVTRMGAQPSIPWRREIDAMTWMEDPR